MYQGKNEIFKFSLRKEGILLPPHTKIKQCANLESVPYEDARHNFQEYVQGCYSFQ